MRKVLPQPLPPAPIVTSKRATSGSSAGTEKVNVSVERTAEHFATQFVGRRYRCGGVMRSCLAWGWNFA